jgi:hypothetical protein
MNSVRTLFAAAAFGLTLPAFANTPAVNTNITEAEVIAA